MNDDTNDTQRDGDALSSDTRRSTLFDGVVIAPP